MWCCPLKPVKRWTSHWTFSKIKRRVHCKWKIFNTVRQHRYPTHRRWTKFHLSQMLRLSSYFRYMEIYRVQWTLWVCFPVCKMAIIPTSKADGYSPGHVHGHIHRPYPYYSGSLLPVQVVKCFEYQHAYLRHLFKSKEIIVTIIYWIRHCSINWRTYKLSP